MKTFTAVCVLAVSKLIQLNVYFANDNTVINQVQV